MDNWFLGVACAGSQCPAPGASLPDVHKELTGRGRHLLLPETDLLTPPPSPPSVVQLGVYGGPPGGAVSCDASVSLYCLHPAGQPCLLFRACRYSSGLIRRGFCGLWRCCLHLMLRHYCRFFRLKALRDMHGGGLKELRTAPDLTPRATKVMARTGPYRQHCDRRVHQTTRWSMLPSHVATRPPPPSLESEASEVASRHSHSGLAQPDSRRAALPREWRLHPQTVQLIWRCFGLAQLDLFVSLETSHCQLFYSLNEGTLGTDTLAHSWPRGLCKYAFPPVSLLAQTPCKIREEEEQILHVAPYWPTRTCSQS